MWENITRQEKGGIVSHGAPAVILYESKIPDIETGLASADRPIDAARAEAPDPGRDHPGIVGGIISEWWATSFGNGGWLRPESAPHPSAPAVWVAGVASR